MIIKTEGIVLRSFDYRETSRIATLFSKDYGKVTGIMKGIRTNPRKFGSSVDKFSVNEFVYYKYSRTDLHLISQCDLKQFYFPIRQDYKRNLAANYATELVDVVMPQENPNNRIYNLLLKFLAELESVKDIDKLVHIFQIKILVLSGFRPHLDSCVKTGKRIDGKAWFDLRSGGLVNLDFPVDEEHATIISRGTISSLIFIERSSWDKCLRLGLTYQAKKELKYILNNFLVYHLERKIKSAKYLQRM
ncbi:MAG: DNA repair protein RecO (recombination protein O) [Lysobacterales bacterium]|jgi:DNA repair protein RecO (recombination protein O)